MKVIKEWMDGAEKEMDQIENQGPNDPVLKVHNTPVLKVHSTPVLKVHNTPVLKVHIYLFSMSLSCVVIVCVCLCVYNDGVSIGVY